MVAHTSTHTRDREQKEVDVTAVSESDAADAFAAAARRLMRNPDRSGYRSRPQGMPERRKR